MRYVILMGLVVGMLAGCTGPGFGVKDAETKGGDGQAPAPAKQHLLVPDKTPGFSIWSMFGGNREFVRKRLDPGLGKPKAEQIAKFGQPVQCTPDPKGGEVCAWHDAGMAEGGTADPSMHQVYYSFDKSGVAREWDYRGVYGKLSSRDAEPQAPASAPKAP